MDLCLLSTSTPQSHPGTGTSRLQGIHLLPAEDREELEGRVLGGRQSQS